MRIGALIVFAIVVAALAPLPTFASSGVVHPTLVGSTYVLAARDWEYSGRLVTQGTNSPVLASGVIVRAYIDGNFADDDVTDAQGRYLVRVSFPRGEHTLVTRILLGGSVEGESDPLAVHSEPTWPAAMAYLRGEAGFYTTEANISWHAPWTDGGYPVLSYHLDRSKDGGPFAAVFDGPDLGFVDLDILPGHNYVYRGTATTAWGTSNTTQSTYVANLTTTNVSILGFRLCDIAACVDVADGGSFNTNATVNVTIQPLLYGVVDDEPASAPGIAGRSVFGRVQFPEIARNFTRTSTDDGSWLANLTGYWAHAPITGCESFPVVALARTANQGHQRDDGSFTLCAP